MTKIKIEAEFEVDDIWCADSYDQEERDWFWKEVMPDAMVILHSNEAGDTISIAKSFTIKETTFNTKQ